MIAVNQRENVGGNVVAVRGLTMNFKGSLKTHLDT